MVASRGQSKTICTSLGLGVAKKCLPILEGLGGLKTISAASNAGFDEDNITLALLNQN